MMTSKPIRAMLWFIFTVVVAAAAFGAQQSTSSDDEKGKALVETKCTLCMVSMKLELHPEAETKKLVEGSCGSCHGLELVTSAQKTKDEWTEVVRNMISYGATIKEPEIPSVADYLAKHYGQKK